MCRSVRNEIINKPLARGVLDGHLLAQFAQQPIKRQKEMMKQIGSSSTTVFSDLHSLSGFW
jgi:cleavage and polyadenylation specificity factor subunit 1